MAADNELENLKTDCITALRKGDEDAFDAAALKFQESSAGDLQFIALCRCNGGAHA